MMYRKLFLVAAFAVLGVFVVPSDAFARSLSTGLSGSDVTALQNALTSKGYLTATATGYFGPATLAAVKKFQCDKAIVCSGASYGLAGPATQAALGIGGSTATATTITGGSTARATGAFEFSGWIPYWRSEKGTADVIPHLSQLKSVMPFGYTMTTDGHLHDAMNIDNATWQSLIAAARKSGTRVIPTVMWGNGDAIHAVLSDATSRVALEDEIANLVKEKGFDGIDIDFEAKKAETKDYFSLFLKGLYQRMGNKWVYCTVEARMPLNHRYLPGQTIPPDATTYANDYAEMNKYCDRVEIMGYDQGTVDRVLNQNQIGPYAPVADPLWVSELVTLAAQSISKNKIIIGVPTYGYEYTVSPTATGYQYQVLWPFNPTYATNLAVKLGISPIRNSAGEVSFSYKSSGNFAPTGDQTDVAPSTAFGEPTISYSNGTSTVTGTPFNYVSWSDAQAIADKVALARKLGVRGVAVFKFDGGEDPLMWSVLK